jgi:hypothetical protein
MSTSNPTPFCANCRRAPDEINEYVEAGAAEGMTPQAYVLAEEGTLDRATGAFLCTECYYRLGQPAGRWPHVWTATPENLANLYLGEYGPHEVQRRTDTGFASALDELKARLAREL